MQNLGYPFGQDFFWICSDRSNNVAAFATAGEGPIPTAILEIENFLEIGDALARLPMLEPERKYNPQTRDFDSLARRGIFAFDWSDAHRMSDFLNGYELISQPKICLKADDLPKDLQVVTSIISLNSLEFSESKIVPISSYFQCISYFYN